MEFYNPELKKVNITSICISNCGVCEGNDEIPVNNALSKNAHKDGFFILLILLPISHTDDASSNKILLDGLKAVETVIACVKRINQNQSILPNLSLGYHILDTISDPEVAAWHMMSVYGPGKNLNLVQYKLEHFRAVSVISGGSTRVSERMKESADYHKVLDVDYTTFLNMTTKSSSYFHPIAPSGIEELIIMVDVIMHYGWRHIVLLHTDSDLGLQRLSNMQTILKGKNICFTRNILLTLESELNTYNEIAELLLGETITTKVVVLLIEDTQIVYLLDKLAVEVFDNQKIIPLFIGGSSFLESVQLRKGIYKSVVNKSISVSLLLSEPTETIQHIIKDLQSSTNDGVHNPWFSEELWNAVRKTLNPKKRDLTINRILQAVYSVALALQDLTQNECPSSDCSELFIDVDTPISLKLKHYLDLKFKDGNQFGLPWATESKYIIQALWFENKLGDMELQKVNTYCTYYY